MITLEKKNQINKAVENFLRIIKFNSKAIPLRTELNLKMQRIFKKQSDLFWKLESKNNWLDKIYLQAQKELSLEKRMSQNPEERIDFIANLTGEWHDDINDDKTLNKRLNKSYVSAYNLAGQEVLNQFKIQANFNLRNLKFLESLKNRANLTAPKINDTSWQLVNNKIADGFWKEGKHVDKVARDIRGMFEETYKHRAKNIARTEVGNALSEAQYKSYKEMEIEEVQWLINPEACELCLPLDNQKRKIGEKFNNGKGWTGYHPLVHPYCECDIVALTPKEFKPSKYWTGN